ncbi:major capsid protein [Apis mellifera associated microvirus 37]|nr:major capsid protein [Apis mellifera associated microvirus 37]
MRRNWFDLSYEHLLSGNMGELIPCGIKETYPNDTWKQESLALIRTLPLLKPLMHRVDAKLIHFFVPKRIIWTDYPDFITGGEDGTAEPEYPKIEVPDGGFAVGSLAHHLGVTPLEGDGQLVSALPFRAVALCFNHWLRNQFLVAPVNVSFASGLDTTTNTSLLMGMWEKDYYTTLADEPQLGTDTVIPLVGNAPVKSPFDMNGSNYQVTNNDTVNDGQVYLNTQNVGNSGFFADMQDVAGISIIQQRISNYMQRFKENKSMYGAEYKDYLRSLGVRFSDATLQIPQRLGMDSTVLQFSEVLATAQSEGIDIGDMKGHGITGLKTKGFKTWFEESGFVVSFLFVRPKTGYLQAMDPMWFYETKYDEWQPGFEHVGQAEVKNKQLRLGHNQPEGILGWGTRFDHLRYSENRVSGEFYDVENDWHMYRDIPVDAALNASLVTANPTDRIFPVDRRLADQLKIKLLHKIHAKRLISPNINAYLR